MKTIKNDGNIVDPNDILKRLNDKRYLKIRRDCFKNAKSLIEESEILFTYKHYSRAFF